MPASWQILLKQSNVLYYGKITEAGFDLILAAGVGRGNSLLEISGVITIMRDSNKKGSWIKLTHRPNQTSQVAWVLISLFFLIFLGLVLLNYTKTGNLNGIIILPTFGLLGTLLFALLYKRAELKSRYFLSEILQLRKVSYNS
ncbi:MAG: hypothetical protein ACRYG7_23615 [Janthinobacterium lividum]